MRDERWTIADYTPEAFERVRQTCLHVATVLGSQMEQVTIVGGAVPSFLVPPDRLPEGAEPHPGTVDLDLGLELAVLDDEGYKSIAELLRSAGYRAEQKDQDRLRRQTWCTDPRLGPPVTIDFLIPRSPSAPPEARLQHLEGGFAAIIADGLQLVARDRRQVPVAGRTVRGEGAEREVWVCGPGAFVVLKALAPANREKPKDAFDLCYVLRNYADGVASVAAALRPLLNDPDAQRATRLLERDFRGLDGLGPSRAATFVYGEASPANQAEIEAYRAEVRAYVLDLLAALR